ncbi:MAG: murein L,D-transpeptidase catalytic domain family protein [Acidobacteria bacterium]|nr:murein L,D-transpeptidase catalytic domain family protein [Acidobacteriota bacterium]
MSQKLISVLVATLLCFAALPWNGRTEPAARAATLAKSAVNRRVSDAIRSGVGRIDLGQAKLGGVSIKVLRLALGAVRCAVAAGDIAAPRTLTLIDYSRPSIEPRLWVFDLKVGRLLFKELVAHGRNTGENMATRFSDAMNSLQTSLGLFVTLDTYVGNKGYSLRLDGLEPGVNGHARERAIVMHGAPYVDATRAAMQGRIGRSWGCPALREAVARQVIDTIRGGGVIFAYYPDANWLRTSRFLNGCDGASVLATSWSAHHGAGPWRPALIQN